MEWIKRQYPNKLRSVLERRLPASSKAGAKIGETVLGIFGSRPAERHSLRSCQRSFWEKQCLIPTTAHLKSKLKSFSVFRWEQWGQEGLTYTCCPQTWNPIEKEGHNAEWVNIYNPSTWETKVGELRIWGQSGIYSGTYLKNKTKKEGRRT
jgi:hypothetical protein